MGMGLLTSAISKAEDKHKTMQDGQKRARQAGGGRAGRQLSVMLYFYYNADDDDDFTYTHTH